MISFAKKKRVEPTYVLAVLGDYGRVESALARTIARLEEIARDHECRIVAALEDRRWESVPLVQTLAMRFPPAERNCGAGVPPAPASAGGTPAPQRGRLTVVRGDCSDLPGKLFTAAAAEAQGEYLHFIWPGCLPDGDAVAAACEAAASEDLDWLGFADARADQLPELCSPDLGDRFYSYYLACGRFLSLSQAVVRRTSVFKIDGFDAAPLLQRDFDADFWLRSIRNGQRGLFRRGKLGSACWDWDDFPLAADFRMPRFLAHSYRVRAAGRANDPDRHAVISNFAADLPPTLQRTVERISKPEALARKSCESAPRSTTPYRIAVTGGPWEFAHNQLCFFNHFKQLEGQGQFTYVPLLDHLIEPERDLAGIDAVIISRGRHAHVRTLLDYCQRHAIATLYMIDDNWLSVGSDWPDPYASIFSPGLPQYEMFLSCLRECDAVLTYNDVLAGDVRPYARRVIQLPTNVRATDFAAPLRHAELKFQIDSLADWRRQTGGIIAGYIGSLRFSEGAFRALASPAIQRSRPVKIVLFGVISEQQRRLFGTQAEVLPYVGYDHYAAAIGAMAPEILVAPLDASRTSRSKCPNKYLEYSMSGAAGVYSNVPPYTGTIIPGKTGLLVADDLEESWVAAIARLADDESLRQSIATAARVDVLARYETAVVAPAFAEALSSLIRERRASPRFMAPEPAAC